MSSGCLFRSLLTPSGTPWAVSSGSPRRPAMGSGPGRNGSPGRSCTRGGMLPRGLVAGWSLRAGRGAPRLPWASRQVPYIWFCSSWARTYKAKLETTGCSLGFRVARMGVPHSYPLGAQRGWQEPWEPLTPADGAERGAGNSTSMVRAGRQNESPHASWGQLKRGGSLRFSANWGHGGTRPNIS